MDKRRQENDSAVRNRVREKMKEQESGGGSWAIDVPSDKKLELKDNQKEKGICVKHLDFLPYKVTNSPGMKSGDIDMWRNYGVHRNVGPDEITVICLKETFGLPCPVCEKQNKLYKAAETEAEKKIAGAMYLKKRSLFNVIDLDNEDAGVQVLDISYHLFGKQLKEELDTAPDYKYDNFPALKGGFTLKIRFNKKSFGETTYYEAKRIDFEERDAYKDGIIDETNDLDGMIKSKTAEELEDILVGRSTSSKNEEKKEESEQSSRRERPSRRERVEEAKEAPVTKEPFGKQDEEPKEEPRQRRTLARAAKQEKKEFACPHGGEFAVDTDILDDCPDCELSEACGAEYDKRKAEGK